MRVIEVTLMDRRWQLVLDCLDTEQAPWSYGTLVAFRKRLIEMHMDRRLIERTIEIASHTQEARITAITRGAGSPIMIPIARPRWVYVNVSPTRAKTLGMMMAPPNPVKARMTRRKTLYVKPF